jgi:hypothetical protein
LCGPSGQAAWTVHHVENHTLLGHSPPASQAGRRVGPALDSLLAHMGVIDTGDEPKVAITPQEFLEKKLKLQKMQTNEVLQVCFMKNIGRKNVSTLSL